MVGRDRDIIKVIYIEHSYSSLCERSLLREDTDDIFVRDHMRQAHFLRLRIEFTRFTPHERVSVTSHQDQLASGRERGLLCLLEMSGQTSMHRVTNVLDRCTWSETDRVRQIWQISPSLGIYPVR
jgi:hypothetical protein